MSEFTPIVGDRLVIPMTVMEMEDCGDVIIKVLSNVLNRLIEVNTKVQRILFFIILGGLILIDMGVVRKIGRNGSIICSSYDVVTIFVTPLFFSFLAIPSFSLVTNHV